MFIAGHVGLVLLYLLLLLAFVPAWLACVGSLALLGTYYAATDGVLSATAAEFLPPALRSSGLAIVQTALAGGGPVSKPEDRRGEGEASALRGGSTGAGSS